MFQQSWRTILDSISYTTLDAEVIRTFIKQVNVFKAEKIDGQRTQKIQIIFNEVGKINLDNTKKA